jgi:acyl carrier protein
MLTDAQRAALVKRLVPSQPSSTQRIPRRAATVARPPLSYGQEQLWFVDRFAPGLPTYNIPHVLRLSGALDRRALERALGALTVRHEALRTRLVASDTGQPVQQIDPAVPYELKAVELSEADVPRFIRTEAMRPFDLAAGPLLRTCLVRQGENEHLLVVVFHHTIFDGWSAGVFLRDLAALYRAEVTGEPSVLTELPVQFADYAVWERQRLFGSTLTELEGYWRRTLAGFETIAFPTDLPRPAVDDFTGRLVVHNIDATLLNDLRNLSRSEGATLFSTLLAGLLALLSRYTGQTDLVIGTVSANRDRAELTPIIGFLVNTLPVRCDVSGDPTFLELLGRAKDAAVGAFAHQDLPFGKLVDTLNVERDASRAPLFQIALTYAEPDENPLPAGGVDFLLTDLVRGVDAAKVDLTFTTEARRDGLWIECCYKTALFDPASIERLLGHLENLLRGVAANPGARVSQLPLLTEPELGAALVNERVRVLDEYLNPVPVGVTGGLYVDDTPTGELARRRIDGSVVVRGRAEDRVTIRGLPVESADVEAALSACPGVAEAVVIGTGPADNRQLAGYLCPEPGSAIDVGEVRAWLTRAMPAALIPAHLVPLDAIPLTADGTVDRDALPVPSPRERPDADTAAPVTVIEAVLADIYATVLGLPEVTATDSFFDLGGNSLHAMRLVSVLDAELEVDIGAATVFLAPTPRQLAALLRTEHGFGDRDLNG